MGRYISYSSDLLGRHPAVVDINSAGDVGSNWIAYAENYVDGYLGTHFAIPFNSSNLTVRDLCLDVAWARIGLLNAKEAELILEACRERMDRLKEGKEVMIDSGSIIVSPLATTGAGYSTTSGYKQVFGPDDPLYWGFTSGSIQDFQERNRDD